jgi:Uma2 family endonuclease
VYEPDCDYVDGELVERNVGEYEHSAIQEALLAWFRQFRKTLGIRALPELRVRIAARRFWVPDICVTIGNPGERILSKPPLLCIEILSPEDRMSRIMERIGDYRSFGVPNIWIIDPATHKGYSATDCGLLEARDGFLRTASPDFALSLEELFLAAEE